MFSTISRSYQFCYPENLTPHGWVLKGITDNVLGRVGMMISSSVYMLVISGFRQPILYIIFLKHWKHHWQVSHFASKKFEIPLPLLFHRVCWIKMVREAEGRDGEWGRKMRHWTKVTSLWSRQLLIYAVIAFWENNWNPLCQVHSVQIPLKSS